MSAENPPILRESKKDVVTRVLETLVERHCSLGKACEAAGVAERSFHRYVSGDRELAEIYERTMRSLADSLALETVDIADSDTDPNKARNMISARQWLAKVLNPKKYSDRVDINVTQTIEVGNTLALARQRMLSVRDQPLVIENEKPIESIAYEERAADKQSVKREEFIERHRDKGQVPDIFD